MVQCQEIRTKERILAKNANEHYRRDVTVPAFYLEKHYLKTKSKIKLFFIMIGLDSSNKEHMFVIHFLSYIKVGFGFLFLLHRALELIFSILETVRLTDLFVILMH